MVRISGAKRPLLRGEDGFTLAETLVATTMMVTVLFAIYSIFDTTVRLFDYGGDELEAVENARLGLERMAREIRAAYPQDGGVLLSSGDSDEITFQNRPATGPPETITYSLSGGSRSYLRRNGQRVVGPLDGADGLRFAYCAGIAGCSSVLTAEHQVDLVRIRVNARAPGAANVVRTLTTDVYLRNREARR